MGRPIYGYMRAYDGLPDERIRQDEQGLSAWAAAEDYALKAIYHETENGSISALTELISELNRTGTRTVVVPSIAHLGSSDLLQDHLGAYVVHCANAEVFEVNDH